MVSPAIYWKCEVSTRENRSTIAWASGVSGGKGEKMETKNGESWRREPHEIKTAMKNFNGFSLPIVLLVFTCGRWRQGVLSNYSSSQRFKSKRKIANGKDCVTFHRTTAYHCCHSLHAFTGSCEKFSFLRYDSSSALSWKYEPGQNRIRTFLKTPVVFSGFSLLSLECSSLAVFPGVQDVVELVFHVSIKWETALLVHHFVVRRRLIESQPFVDFLSMSFNYSVYARSWPCKLILVYSERANNYIKMASPFFPSFSVVRATQFFGIIKKEKRKGKEIETTRLNFLGL